MSRLPRSRPNSTDDSSLAGQYIDPRVERRRFDKVRGARPPNRHGSGGATRAALRTSGEVGIARDASPPRIFVACARTEGVPIPRRIAALQVVRVQAHEHGTLGWVALEVDVSLGEPAIEEVERILRPADLTMWGWRVDSGSTFTDGRPGGPHDRRKKRGPGQDAAEESSSGGDGREPRGHGSLPSVGRVGGVTRTAAKVLGRSTAPCLAGSSGSRAAQAAGVDGADGLARRQARRTRPTWAARAIQMAATMSRRARTTFLPTVEKGFVGAGV